MSQISLDDTDTTPDPSHLVVSVRGLGKRFGDSVVLDNLDLDIRVDEFVALLGRSGSGKSTLLRILGGFDDDATGMVQVAGRQATVFQESRLIPWARLASNVRIGLRGKKSRSDARRALEEVGLAGRERSWPITLSGGEAQRVALARALVREPELLLLDEPFGALDALTRIKMHTLLIELCRRHSPGVLLVTHDVDEAITLADRVLVLREGVVAVDLPVPEEVSKQRTPEEFTRIREQLLSELGSTTSKVRSRRPRRPRATRVTPLAHKTTQSMTPAHIGKGPRNPMITSHRPRLPRSSARWPTTAAALLLAAVLPMSVACSSSDEDKPAEGSIVLNVGDQAKLLQGTLEVGKQADTASSNYSINFATFANGPEINAAFNAGRLDVGIMGDTPAIFSRVGGTDVVAIAADITPPGYQSWTEIVARPGSGINSVADLAGKKVSYVKQTASEGYLLQALAEAGLTKSDITPVEIPSSAQVQALASDQADAAILAVTAAAPYLREHPDATVIRTKVPSLDILLARRAALSDPAKRAAIFDLAKRLRAATLWGDAHKDVWAQDQYIKNRGFDPDGAREFITIEGVLTYGPVTEEIQHRVSALADILKGLGQIPTDFQTSALFDQSVLSEADTILESAKPAESP